MNIFLTTTDFDAVCDAYHDSEYMVASYGDLVYLVIELPMCQEHVTEVMGQAELSGFEVLAITDELDDESMKILVQLHTSYLRANMDKTEHEQFCLDLRHS